MSDLSPPSTRRGRPVWFGLAEYRKLPNGRVRLRLRVRVVALVLATLAFTGFVGKTVFCYWFFTQHRGFNDFSAWQAMQYPLNRDDVRDQFGAYQLATAKEALKNGDVRTAYLYLQQGLARKPDDLDGRLLMADFDRLTGRPELAVRRLREGLLYHGDAPDYLKQYIRILLTERHDSEMMKFADDRMADLGSAKPSTADQIIAYGGSQVLAMHGQFTRALEYLQRAEIQDTPDGIAQQANIAWLRGDSTQAIRILERWVNGNPMIYSDAIYDLLSRYLREADRADEALRFALQRVTSNPNSYNGRLELITCYMGTDRMKRASEEVTAYLRDFGDNEQAMLLLANVATDKGQTEICRRVYERAAERGYNMGAFGMLYIEAHLAAGEFEKAAAFCDQLQAEGPSWINRFGGQFNFLRTVAAKALHQTEMAQLYRGRMMEARLTPNELIPMAARYISVGMPDEAREALLRARSQQPNNENAISRLIQLDLDSGRPGDLTTFTREMLELRRPAYSVVARLRTRLNSDTFIFEPNRDELLDKLDAVLAEAQQL